MEPKALPRTILNMIRSQLLEQGDAGRELVAEMDQALQRPDHPLGEDGAEASDDPWLPVETYLNALEAFCIGPFHLADRISHDLCELGVTNVSFELPPEEWAPDAEPEVVDIRQLLPGDSQRIVGLQEQITTVRNLIADARQEAGHE